MARISAEGDGDVVALGHHLARFPEEGQETTVGGEAVPVLGQVDEGHVVLLQLLQGLQVEGQV